jgi:hypothetical protein
MEVQYCMACGHQAMDSLRWPAVTNMRANGDGERKGLFEPFAYKNNASFYQDRLGTNIGKAALKNRTVSVTVFSPRGARCPNFGLRCFPPGAARCEKRVLF